MLFHYSGERGKKKRKKGQLIKSQDFCLCNKVMRKTHSEKAGLHLSVFQH